MKRNTPLKFIAAVTALSGLVLIGSCVKTDNVTCSSSSESPVTKVSGADTALVNQADTITITFLIANGCGKRATINPAVATQTANVHVITSYEGCACTQVAYIANHKYVFKSPNPGTYTLSFWGGNDTTIIEKRIVVK